MAERRRVNTRSIEGMVAAVQSITNGIEPPIALSERERFYFDMVVASREASTWTRHDKMVACLMAKTHYRIEQVGYQLDREGFSLENNRGTPVQNPLAITLASLSNGLMNYTRMIGLTASASGLSHPSQKARNQVEAGIRDNIEGSADDPLI
jgi:hypothetical protein